MIRKLKVFYAVCDVCGEKFNVNGIKQVFEIKKDATLTCKSNGWRQLGRKKWACDKCSKKIDSYGSKSNIRGTMTTPIIDPASLSDKQRESIRKKYHMAKVRVAMGFPNYEDDIMLISELESKYGTSMFEKGD